MGANDPAEESGDAGRRALVATLAAAGGGALWAALEGAHEAHAQPLAAALAAGATVRAVDSLGALRGLPAPPSGTRSVVLALGAAEPHDGGDGVFAWVEARATTRAQDDGGTRIVPTTPQAPEGYWRRVFVGEVNVRWFALLREGGDWTRALRAAVRAAVRPGRDGAPHALHLPAGNYVLSGTIQLPERGLHLRGDGPDATNLQFQPGLPGECVLLDLTARDTRRPPDAQTLLWPDAPNPGRIIAVSVRHLSVSSVAGDPATKIAVRVNDGDGVVLDDLRIGTLWTTGGRPWVHADPPPTLPNPGRLQSSSSVGIELLAGQLCVLSGVHAHADAPIRVGPAGINRTAGASTGLMCDHLRLDGVHLSPHPTEAGLRILPGVVVTNLVMDGDNSVSGGSFGVHWERGDAAVLPGQARGGRSVHQNVAIRNLRVETLVGYRERSSLPGHAERRRSVHLGARDDRNPLYNVTLDNVACATAYEGTGSAADPDGLYARHVEFLTLTGCSFPSNHPATRHLDIDPTCSEVDWRNCRFGSQGVATYDPGCATATGIDPRMVGVSTGVRAQLSAPSVLPSSATYVRSTDERRAIDRPASSFGVFVIRYRAVVETGAQRAFRLQALSGWPNKFGRIDLVARDRAGDALEGGAWIFSRATLRPLHHTPDAASGSAVPDGKIGLAALSEFDIRVVNNLAHTMDVTVTVEFRAVSDALDPRSGRAYEIP